MNSQVEQKQAVRGTGSVANEQYWLQMSNTGLLKFGITSPDW
jgi:hypothetical protein